jgi:hypothetical protein
VLKPSAVLEEQQRVDQPAHATEALDDRARIVALEKKVARLEALIAGAAAFASGMLEEPDPSLRL